MHSGAPVPFNDLSRGVVEIREEIDAALGRVVDSGWFVLGPEHDALETELAEFLGVRHAINVGNGTDALELALAALGVRSGGMVVTVANAGAYTTIAARLLGAEPVYCDVDEKTLLMSAETLERALDNLPERPQAIVVTHLYGALAPIRDIMAVARRHMIPVVEDCAQSFGAQAEGVRGGAFGDISTTSFYPTKNLGALGDGGAVFTNNPDFAAAVKKMRQYGWDSKYSIEHRHGRNSRLDEMQAAVLRVKLPRLDANNERRREIHLRYESATCTTASLLNRASPAFIAHLAVLTASDRPRARAIFTEHGIATDVHYPIADHTQKYPDFTPRPMPLGVTEWATTAVFSIPMFPELTTEEVDRVVAALESI
jgi:aminotransferase EvaB